jgi:Carboxypeptidase regulatory-like domain/TonB dependent receptor
MGSSNNCRTGRVIDTFSRIRSVRVVRFSLWMLGSLLLVSTALWAQLYSGSVSGLVKDPSGAVVQNAKITLVDQDKGFTFTALADGTGSYLVRAVPPGTYKITAESPGFKGQARPGVVVDVNQNVTVNFALEIGQVAETMLVSAAAPLLQTEDATGGQVISRKLVDTMPLLSRNPTALAYLTPGITSVGPGCEPSKSTSGCQAPTNFVSNGGRNSTSDILLDGVTTTTFEQNSGVNTVVFTPGVDSVEEFAVQQSNFSAEYGFTGGTIVNIVTRSGTNKFHGSVYDYLQNSAANAVDYFTPAGHKTPSVKLNDFGGTIGGPIQKDKTFFFFDYEGQRTGLPLNYSEGVPSDAMKQGDFGELCGYNGGTFDPTTGLCSVAAGQLWDPFTGTYDPSTGTTTRSAFIPFNNLATYISPGNPKLVGTPYQLAPTAGNLIDPVASQMIQGYPEPNLNVGSSNYNYKHNWVRSAANRTNVNQIDSKIDRQFGYKNLLSGKFSLMRFSQPHWGEYGDSNLFDPVDRGNRQRKGYNVAINDTHTFNSRLVINVSYGLAWWHGTFGPGIASVFPQVDAVKLLGMPSYMNDSGYHALPSLNPTGYGSIGTGGWTIGLQTEDTQQLRGNLSWIVGRHELKFGLESRWHHQNYVQPGTPAGYFSYDAAGTGQSTDGSSGDAMASLLTGFDAIPGSFGQYEIPNHVITSSRQIGTFVQDNWKVTNTLTLNLGLRYDINLPRTERHNQMNGLDPTLVSPLQIPGLGTLHGGEVFMNGNHRTNYDTDYKDFAPRFGFAYRVHDKTVLRGGYGIFYSISRSGAAGVGAPGWQGYDQVTPWVYTMNSDGATPWGRLSNPFPNGPTQPVGSSLGALNDLGNAAIGPIASSGKTTPYEQSWSFGVQRELPYQMVLDTSYVGKKGTHLYFGGTENLNHLGAWVETATPAQLTALNTQVNNPFAPYVTDPNAPLSAPTVKALQLQLPFSQFTSFSGDPMAVANSTYHALQVKLEKRFSKGLSLLASYVWSKSIDDASVPSSSTASFLGGGSSSLQDPNKRSLERGLSTFDQAHVFQLTYTYELPIGRGKLIGRNMSPALNAILGGWQTTGTWRFTDGFPIMLSQGNVQDPLPTYGTQRPNLSATLTCNGGGGFLTNYFANPSVVTDAPGWTLGNAPRTIGSCRTPGVANSSLALLKEFGLPKKLGEGAKAQLRLEAYNALNHPQFAGPSADIDNNFGLVTSTSIAARQVQVALKISF